MKSKNAIQAILFDIGWTLIYPYPTRKEANERYLHDHGYYFRVEDLESASRAAANYYRDHRWLTEAMQNNPQFWQDYYTIFVEQLGINEPGLAGALNENARKSIHFHLYPETLSVLQELQRRGFLIGAVSNWNTTLPDILEQMGLTGYLNSLVVSDLIGYYKPQGEIFRYALSSLRVDAAEAVHIGDSFEADIEGARQVGIRSIWLDRSAGIGDDRPDRIQTLSELLTDPCTCF
jgi:HAD superfamily hydrolase (TIGR01549 family)